MKTEEKIQTNIHQVYARKKCLIYVNKNVLKALKIEGRSLKKSYRNIKILLKMNRKSKGIKEKQENINKEKKGYITNKISVFIRNNIKSRKEKNMDFYKK